MKIIPKKNTKNMVTAGKGLRILIFNWRDTKHKWAGGAERYVHELAKRWVKDGHSVTVFCGNDRFCKREEVVDGVRVIRRGGMYLVYFWAVYYYLIKLRKEADIIVDSENGTPFFAPLFSFKPVVLLIHHVHMDIFTEHLNYLFAYFAKFIEGKLMPFAYRNNRVITVSESTRQTIIHSKLFKEANISIINPGVTPPQKLYPKTSYPSIIYLGRLKAYKNIDTAIRAFAKVSRKIKKARLLIVGDGESDRALYDLAGKLGLHDKIRFYGKVSEKEKLRLLSESWMAVQPSSIEGWGITVLEANACRTPVIASNVNGLRDSIIHNKTGLLVKEKDTDAFSKAMMLLIYNKNKRSVMADNASRWAQKFSWDESSYKFYGLIFQLVSVKSSVVIPGISQLANRITSLF